MSREKDADRNKAIELFYKCNNKNIHLSNWGKFFINLGNLTCQMIAKKSGLIIALAVPTRAFASVLISLGFIFTKLHCFHDENYIIYSEYLKTLPLGTSVLLRSEVGRKYKGLFQGCKNINGKLHFAIEYEHSSIRYVKNEESKRIEVLDSEVTLPKTQKGREIIPESDFCKILLGDECTSILAEESNLEIAIIGPKKLLRNEAIDQEFVTRTSQIGILQEILRIREFQSSNRSYRTRVISDRNRYVSAHSNISDPPLVIFDGALGFLKWRNYWKKSNWIVILDRTEYQFDSAVEQINREYIQNRKNDSNIEISNIEIPFGIEVMVFKVGE